MKLWENKDKRKPSNYTTGVVIQRADNPTEHQTQWIHDYKENIVSACAHELVCIKNEIKIPTLSLSYDALTSGQFSRLEEKNGDTIFNLKLRQLGGDVAVITEFLSYPSLQTMTVNEMTGKRCNIKFEVLIESIYVGTAITIQCKLDRACVAEPKKMAIIRKPMKITVVDEEIHETVGTGEDEVEIPEGSTDENSEYSWSSRIQK